MKARFILTAFALSAAGLLNAQEVQAVQEQTAQEQTAQEQQSVLQMEIAQNEQPLIVTARLGIGSPGTGRDYFTEGSGSSTTGLAGIYGDYYGPCKASGVITADVLFTMKYWLQCGITIGCGHYSNTLYSGLDGRVKKERNGYAVYIIPSVKMSYLNTNLVKLYASLGFGMGKYFGFDNLKGGSTYTVDGVTYSDEYDDTLKVESQFIPFGIEVGKKIYGFGELCIGTMITGCRAGIGYRF